MLSLFEILNHEIKILLYIIIGIGYLISRLYKKELKKQNQKQVNKRPMSSRTAEEIFRDLQKTLDLQMEEEVALPQKAATVVPKEKLRRAQKIFISKEESMLKHYKPIHARKSLKKESMKASSEPIQNVEETRPDIDFDPRQALIFSEILKRPQY